MKKGAQNYLDQSAVVGRSKVYFYKKPLPYGVVYAAADIRNDRPPVHPNFP